MAKLRQIRNPSNLTTLQQPQRLPPSLQESLDATEFKIEKLKSEDGSVEETLVLKGTNMPFHSIDPAVKQEVNKFYYPGGPPDRRPTVQILGSMDEDITLRGNFKATRLTPDKREEPLQIAKILERFVREGKPCRLQVGYYIKFVVLKDINLTYKNSSDIDYALTFVILGDYNPISGDENLQEENISAKVFEAESETDSAEDVREYENEILNLKEEAELFGYEFPPKRGGVFGLLDEIFSTIEDLEIAINDAVDIVDNFVDQIEKTAQDIEKALGTMQRLRGRIYRIQGKLFSAYSTVKNAANPKRLLNSINIFNLIQNMINDFQIDLKRTEDIMRNELIVKIDQTYVVVSGDTWQSIAIRFYNNSDRWEEIKNINPPHVEQVDQNGFTVLKEGEVILIPK